MKIVTIKKGYMVYIHGLLGSNSRDTRIEGLLRESEEFIIRLNLVKASASEENTKQVMLAQGAKKSAKKRKSLWGCSLRR